MNALEFGSRLAGSDRIEVPPEIAAQIPDGSNVRVIVMWETTGQKDDEWRRFTGERFASHYVPEDSVYEKLLNEPPIR